MSAKFIAAVVAAAITITTMGSAPAAAQERRHQDNSGEIALGIAALIAMGLLLSNKDDHDHAPLKEKPYVRDRHGYNPGSITGPRPPRPRPLPDRVRHFELPKHCLRHVETHRGYKRVLGKRCLKRNDVRVNALPQRCEMRFRTGHKNRKGYRVGCLKKSGYRLSRR